MFNKKSEQRSTLGFSVFKFWAKASVIFGWLSDLISETICGPHYEECSRIKYERKQTDR